MLIFPISNLTFIEREKCSADGDLSHEPSNGENIEKQRNQSDEALEEKRREEQISLMKH